MKIRTGFVSNSSGSSFCIWGVGITEDEFNTLSELDHKIFDGLELESIMGDCFWLGKSFTKIKDNETGAHFKESAQKKVDELLGPEHKCSICEEGWYNG